MSSKGKRGGQGNKATTKESKKLDSMMREIRDELRYEFPGFTVKNKLDKNDWVKYFGFKPKKKGLAPDLGIWILDDMIVFMGEGKHQGPDGNADERWWKNSRLAEHINKKTDGREMIYETFATGAASKDLWYDVEELSHKILELDTRWHLREKGFDKEYVKMQVVNTLNEILGKSNRAPVYPEPRGVLDV